MEKHKRIVITGLGVVTPIGVGNDKFWDAACKGVNGVLPLELFDATDYRTKTGGEVRDFNASEHLSNEEIKSMGRSSQFAVSAAKMALLDSKLDLQSIDPYQIAVSMGTTMGEPQVLEECVHSKYDSGDISKIPSTLPRQYPCSTIPASIARSLKLKGPHTIIPTACAAGNYAIGYGFDLIQLGKADVVFAGGSDPFSGIAFTGFNRLLATTEDVVRPFDKNRKGMAVSEGAGILIIESLEHALKRNAKIYAEILGYGIGCDAFKMTIPDPSGSGGILALKRCMANSQIGPEEIDYICAHGTGTGENDKTETFIVKEVLGKRAHDVPMSSLKSMLGHTMGAASAIEAAACAMMIKNQTALPTINYSEPDPDCDLDYVANTPRKMELRTVVSNAYAFAGNTSSIALRRYEG
ncbi:beta-ketoacyl-[acyl-carrier-protein] synthase family protein [Chitinispirillales bacterium ANBcel5]|uniref:beta-ketoacyl-[acyl-carrier-protein] synthase family protein n=1 Tax=Cellulosispirillum alkaliphilum TaxID=3039283 RepID=UPI002A569505|nr:beta-ketoacyl-[acyl-carrier-protein] synthase family protein [Chitinispirillales bacterium ANBcel5]